VTKNNCNGRDEEEDKLETKFTKMRTMKLTESGKCPSCVLENYSDIREILGGRVGRVMKPMLKRGGKALTLPPEMPRVCVWTHGCPRRAYGTYKC
jgi:hypothetical protein